MSLGIASGARAPLAPGTAAAYNDDVEVVQKFDITRIFPKQARSVPAGCIPLAVLRWPLHLAYTHLRDFIYDYFVIFITLYCMFVPSGFGFVEISP